MKKNKTIAYMMAATLLVGGTFLGTKALFTDKLDTIGELAISTGDVDIEVTDKGAWTLIRNGKDLKDGTTNDITDDNGIEGTAPTHGTNNEDKLPKEVKPETPFANNLKMGDTLTKTVRVENKGTLNAVLNLEENEQKGNIPDKLKEIMVLDEVLKDKGGNIISNGYVLKPGEEITVELKISLNENPEQLHNTANGDSANHDDIEDTVINLTDRWELSATQVTENTGIK